MVPELARILDGEIRSAPGCEHIGEILFRNLPALARAAGRSVPVSDQPRQAELFPRAGRPHWLSERTNIQ
jgi:hypothetical protein